jgi:hypothetical protein
MGPRFQIGRKGTILCEAGQGSRRPLSTFAGFWNKKAHPVNAYSPRDMRLHPPTGITLYSSATTTARLPGPFNFAGAERHP